MNHEAATTVEYLRSAKSNGDVRLRIVLGNEEELPEQVKVLETFGEESGLCSVSLVGCDVQDPQGWKVPNLESVLRVLKTLPKLIHIQFENSNVNGWTLKASAVTEFFRTTRLRLETLEFTAVRVEGTKEELQELAQAMEGMVCLRSCCLQNNFLLWQKKDRKVYPLDEFLQALAKLPLLQDVYIDLDHWNDEAHQTQLMSSSETTKAVLNSPTIHDIFLGKINPSHPVVQDIAEAMANTKNTNNIKFLSLQFRPDYPTENPDTAPTARKPTTPINEALACLTKALRVNCTLKELRLCFGSDTCPCIDETLLQIAKELSQNPKTQLQKFEVIAPCSYGAMVEEAFVELLRTNYTIIELDFFSTIGDKYFSLDASRRTEMHLYMSLNADGRQELFQTHNRSKWVQAISKQSHNLDALYYYLHRSPWLMSHDVTGKPQQVQRKRKRKRPAEEETTAQKIQRMEQELQFLRQENESLRNTKRQKRDTATYGGCAVM